MDCMLHMQAVQRTPGMATLLQIGLEKETSPDLMLHDVGDT